MAILQDLISQIEDKALRDRILQETNKLFKQKKFGLVFEEHLPECTPLYEIPIRVGSNVALKTGYVKDIYNVINIDGEKVTCYNKEAEEEKTFNIDELVVIAQFGEPIYPYLKQIDSVCNDPDSDLWHTLIEADNYHALQLLEYLYAGKVDCIYIDPPYNTGARDWKYNNDYVDNNDAYRHSKWLSMMEKRLKLAKKLLNPKDSVLIVTIDEKEYLHLGCLLEELFSDASIQMVSSVINPAGVSRNNDFYRVDEYIFFIKIGNASPVPLLLDEEWRGKVKSSNKDKLGWNSLVRTGTAANRVDRPNMFYPIYVSNDLKSIIEIGEPIELEQDRNNIIDIEGAITVWPIHKDGTEGRWRISHTLLKEISKLGYVRIGSKTNTGVALTYVPKGERDKIDKGLFKIIGHKEDGSILVDEENYSAQFIPGTQWWISSHNATQYGTNLLTNIIGNNKFTFPKSLYAVHDAIRFFINNKPNALIVDFFAGSGTTLHAVNLLNAYDGGRRHCIMVTNNEVSDAESKNLSQKGFKPGDKDWEDLGIARYVTWPRTKCSITGQNIKGESLKGNYLGNERPLSDGFKSNCAFFKLGFLDKTSVALGKQFKNLLSILWMKAGAYGECPVLESNSEPDMLILPKNKFAVLTNEMMYSEFAKQILELSEIETIYIVTDSENSFKEMIKGFEDKQTYQLYRDYLDNFRINTRR